jgi:MinD-like ATPase involved in chromosome partitioning or flagellar assembly
LRVTSRGLGDVYKRQGEMSPAQASDGLQLKVCCQIPDDPKTVIRSVNNGEPVVASAPSSKFARKITEIASHIRQLSDRRT